MPDCIVVGGGVIGLLTAHQLFDRGVEVLLLERGPLGGESSWAGGGIISPLYPWRYDEAVNVLAERSKQIYPGLAQALLDETGIDSELINSGLFTVSHDESNIFDWADRWSVDAAFIDDPQVIRDIEPMVGEELTSGIWMPDIKQIRNPKFVKALKASLETRGIEFREGSPVQEVVVTDGKAGGVRIKDETLHADKVIIASGAWSAQFGQLQRSVDVNPVKGQMIMFRGKPSLVQRIVLSEGHYVIPRKDGRILAGSTLEKIGFDKEISSTAHRELHEAAVSLIPRLADLSIERQWAGLRPGTQKGIPYICHHDEVEGLYIHAGHYRNGIVLGAASAELMADIVLGSDPWCDTSPYRIDAAH